VARPTLSLVIPVYNEEAVLPELERRLGVLLQTLSDVTCEVVFVNDGSRDRTLELLRAMIEREPRYRAVSFARNFGHQSAITAGIDYARGSAVVVLDADLQDPPEIIVEMLAKWREGYHVVYGRRRKRAGETWFKKFMASAFYRVFAAMIPIRVPLDTGDFRLMDRKVVLALRRMRESHRFIRAHVVWVGFRQTEVLYDRPGRFAGTTNYPFRKSLALALDGVASFSIVPLRFAVYIGAVMALLSSILGALAIFSHVVVKHTVPGWTTTILLVSFLFSVQFLMTGVLGEYVGRIYEQVKGRPLYIVGERIGFRRRSRQDSGERLPKRAP
jgi:dolichol-phosphate mannosyltransferase